MRYPDPSTLHRKDAPSTSVRAAHSVNVNKREAQVLQFIKNAGERGITLSELVQIYTQPPHNIPYGTLSARPTSLHKKGLIFYTENDERNRSRVMRSSEFKTGQTIELFPEPEQAL